MLDKVSDPSLPDSLPKKDVKDLQLLELLPDARIQENLVWQWSVLVTRVVTKYLKAFQPFQKVVIRHIPHQYSEEMAAKSDIVSALLIKGC